MATKVTLSRVNVRYYTDIQMRRSKRAETRPILTVSSCEETYSHSRAGEETRHTSLYIMGAYSRRREHLSPCSFPTLSLFDRRLGPFLNMEDANDLLEKFKRFPFARGLIPFQAAVQTIGIPNGRVYVHKDGRQRWTVSKWGCTSRMFTNVAI